MSANAPTLAYDALHHLPVEALRHYDNETIFALVEDGTSIAAETVAAGRALHGRWITGEDAVMFRARRAARQLMAGAVMVCAASGALADGVESFDAADKALYSVVQSATVLDGMTTINAMDRGFRELNPVLGDKPSDARITGFIAARLVAQHYAAEYLTTYRTPALLGAAITASAAVAHNMSQGARPDVGNDKANHALIGALIGHAVSLNAGSAKAGCLAGTAAGAVKELADMGGRGKAELADLLATAAGACAASFVPGLSFGPGFIVYRKEW